jgi:hypothetical protein
MESLREIKKRHYELFKYILKKNGISYAKFQWSLKHDFVVSNLDKLTESKRKKFDMEIGTEIIPMRTKDEKKRLNELFKLTIKWAKISYTEYWQWMRDDYVRDNLDMLTDEECEMFNLKRRIVMRSYDAVDTESLTKEERAEVRKQTKALLELLLKKTGKKRKDLIEPVYRDFIYDNSDLLADSQKKKFDKLVDYVYY